jgi:HD-like signal output (HDOD) protein
VVPAVALQALELAKNPECSISEFTSVVEKDVKLATDVLHLANCVFYSPTNPITSLRQAVIWLGFRQCKNLILASSIQSLMKKLTLSEEWIREILWRHSFVTARLAVALNKSLELGFDGEEFTAGLIHDIGRLVIASVVPQEFSQADSLEFNESEATLYHEREILEIDHCAFGAWFAGHNQLPTPLIHVVRYHHTPEKSPDVKSLVTLVALADHMANYLQRAEQADGYLEIENPLIEMLSAILKRPIRQRFEDLAPELMAESLEDGESLSLGAGSTS